MGLGPAQLDSRSHHKSLWALLTYFSTSSSKTVRRACLGETGRIAEDFQCQTASSFSPDDIIGFHGATIAWWISDLKQGHMCYIRRFTQLHWHHTRIRDPWGWSLGWFLITMNHQWPPEKREMSHGKKLLDLLVLSLTHEPKHKPSQIDPVQYHRWVVKAIPKWWVYGISFTTFSVSWAVRPWILKIGYAPITLAKFHREKDHSPTDLGGTPFFPRQNHANPDFSRWIPAFCCLKPPFLLLNPPHFRSHPTIACATKATKTPEKRLEANITMTQ